MRRSFNRQLRPIIHLRERETGRCSSDAAVPTNPWLSIGERVPRSAAETPPGRAGFPECRAVGSRGRRTPSSSHPLCTFSVPLQKFVCQHHVLRSKVVCVIVCLADPRTGIPRSETRGPPSPAASRPFRGAGSTNCCSSPSFLPPCTCSEEQRGNLSVGSHV